MLILSRKQEIIRYLAVFQSFRKHNYYMVTRIPRAGELDQFWQLVYRQQVRVIVMLTRSSKVCLFKLFSFPRHQLQLWDSIKRSHVHSFIHSFIWSIDRLIDRLIHSLIHWFIHSFVLRFGYFVSSLLHHFWRMIHIYLFSLRPSLIPTWGS